MELRDIVKKLDIVDVISSYIDLQRAGNNFKAKCPFHPDDTPSLYVSPSKGIWKCFGCGVGGDVVKFVALYENISYTEALLELAKRYKLPVKIQLRKKDDRLLGALNMVADYYHRNLKDSVQVVDYLKKRGIEDRTIKKFKLGYSPSSEQTLSFLIENQILETYQKTGNILKIDEKHYKDLFVGRLIIPIRDAKGDVVGFGGRILGEGSPKYINSPETEIFKKREILFGFYEGLSYIKERGRAILVEGYFDVMSMHQEGFQETVAPMGTSFGQEHAKVLSSYAQEVILMFDGDQAGRRAIKQTAPHLLREGLNVRILLLPEGEDPDTFVKKHKKELQETLKEAKNLFEWLLEQEDGKAVEDYIYFCGFLKDKLLQMELLTLLSKRTNLPISALIDRMPKHSEKSDEHTKENKLSFHEKVFLFGLYKGLGNKEHLKRINLSPYAIELAEAILREEYHLVPEGIKRQSFYDPERAFEESLRHLSIKTDQEESVSLSQIRQKRAIRLRGIKEDL
ncbi:DNA primase [Thermocrinis sp.]